MMWGAAPAFCNDDVDTGFSLTAWERLSKTTEPGCTAWPLYVGLKHLPWSLGKFSHEVVA